VAGIRPRHRHGPRVPTGTGCGTWSSPTPSPCSPAPACSPPCSAPAPSHPRLPRSASPSTWALAPTHHPTPPQARRHPPRPALPRTRLPGAGRGMPGPSHRAAEPGRTDQPRQHGPVLHIPPPDSFHHLIVIRQWGWTITLNPDGTTSMTNPDRTRVYHGHSPPTRGLRKCRMVDPARLGPTANHAGVLTKVIPMSSWSAKSMERLRASAVGLSCSAIRGPSAKEPQWAAPVSSQQHPYREWRVVLLLCQHLQPCRGFGSLSPPGIACRSAPSRHENARCNVPCTTPPLACHGPPPAAAA
jgi:hypothetical protein